MDWILLFIISKVYQTPILLSLFKFYKYVFRITTNTSELYRICHQATKELPWVNDLNNNNNYEENSSDTEETIPLIEADTLYHETEKVSQQQTFVQKKIEKNIYGYVPPDIVFKIDRSILYSNQLTVERRKLESTDCAINDITKEILKKKRFPGTITSPEAQVLKACLKKIVATNQLTREVNENAHTKYDSTNIIHEQKLLKLWSNLMPTIELESRLTKQWAEIGFQGNDPASDFRGMGVQGLDDLIYYTKTYPEAARQAFVHSQHPVSWYPFAIVGINISQFTIQILRTRQLQYYLFKFGITKDTYQDLYCYFYYTFNEYWNSFEEPRLTVMDFERVFKLYKQTIQAQIFRNNLIPLSLFLDQQFQQQNDSSSPMNEKKSSTITTTTTAYQRLPHTTSTVN
ncbi:ELMO/CED-12 family-domain-containing protein [Cunninghamella echinulata]|nr:ELMO/CED-12 family-domain-containing protein [Cunninghamella echinulata]